jgi:hypothetical protein
MVGKLNARKVETLTNPGRYADGGNLYLRISPNGGKRWMFFYRFGGKRRDMGLGSAAKGGVPLAEARQKADAARAILRSGNDPMAVMGKDAREKADRTIPTFGQFADEYIAAHRPKFRNEKHAAQWEMTVGDAYCKAIRHLPVDTVDTEAILKVLQPIWQKVPEAASRLRGRIENVLDAAKARGFRSGENPATLEGPPENPSPSSPKAHQGPSCGAALR